VDNRAYELLQEGHRLMESYQDREAVPLLELAALLEPHKGSILENLGRAYFNTGRPDDARARFEDCLRVDPTNHFAHYCLSLCLSKLDCLVEAIGHLKMALVMHPQDQRYSETLQRLRARFERGEGRLLA
jgi:tetratricopeptide (TPR) repeat protein